MGPLRSADGAIIGVIASVRDITERKQAEEALRATRDELQDRVRELSELTADLARSNQELERFAYVASHDLQEPLRMVASFTQLLQRRYHDRLDADADQYIAYAVDGATRMQALINDLLAYSRVGTHGQPFRRVEAESLLKQALDNLQIALRETDAVVTHDLLPAVQGDASQLIQLFQNLIGNAIKFRGNQCPRIHVWAAHQDKGWCFAVRDNGIGIEAQFAERIFVIFQRLHTRTEYPGTGMGLAICKKIVERHGGKIWMESAPGQGATFFFTIPEGN
jgi:light-regulated signal transduction histidine kinase (bacteriophytochrome)